MNAADRVTAIDRLIPRPPADIAPLREAFSALVAKQWDRYVPVTTGAKARFIGGMYARACYSMMLLRAGAVRTASMLPLSRGMAITGGGMLLSALNHLAPRAMHRQLLLMSALMGTLDIVLDEAASLGEAAALEVGSFTMAPMSTLTDLIRRGETGWQSGYWNDTLLPAVREYCLAEVRAVAHEPDPANMCHRAAGIDAAIKGMWYVLQFQTTERTREQQWMADTSLLMQMIDDWVDQDEDAGSRLTPVTAGLWNTESIEQLYLKTIRDLTSLLTENGIRSRALQQLFQDLYNDYLHAALDAMRTGIAA